MTENVGTPRYRVYGIDWGRPDGDKSLMIEGELQPDGRIKILNFGEVIEGVHQTEEGNDTHSE